MSSRRLRGTSSLKVAQRRSGNKFYQCTELVLMVMDISPWKTWVALSHVNQRGREIVRESIRKRITFFVGLFIPRAHQITLFALLKMNRAIIIGPLVRCILSLHEDVYQTVNPRQMDIAVSSTSSYLELENLFRTAGFVHQYGMHRKPRMAPGLKRFNHFVMFDGSRTICLIMAKEESLIPTMLMASMSSQYFALSYNHIYSFYPQLLARKEFVVIRDDVSYGRRFPFSCFNFGLTGNEFYQAERACGEACPAVWRCAKGDGTDGIGVFRWGGLGGLDKDLKEDALFDIGAGLYTWRLVSFDGCRNPLCSNCGRGVTLQ